MKLEANNERVYYSYHPRVCERVSEGPENEEAKARAREGKRKESRGKMHRSRETISTFAPSRVHFRPQKDKPERQSQSVWDRTPLNRYWRRLPNVGVGKPLLLFLLQPAEEAVTNS